MRPASSPEMTPGPMFSTSEDLLKALSQPIAVVGNDIMKRRYGTLIDSYATVIRMNNYRIQGREADAGCRTSLRCTTGWPDIEVRNQYLEFTPFTYVAKESSHLSSYQNQGAAPVIAANTDIHPFLPDIPNPSVELALLTLMAKLGIKADVFGFNGFKTGHDRQVKTVYHKTPLSTERDELLKLPNIRLFDDTHPYEQLHDFSHSGHINEGLPLFKKLDLQIKNSRLIEFGAGNGDLSLYLQSLGNQVMAVEASAAAFERIPIQDKIHGNCLDLPLIKKDFDWFISADVPGNLTMNDIKIVISEAARLAKGALVLISTRSESLKANGANLYPTVTEISWWEEQFRAHFDTVTTIPMNLSDQFVLKASGSKRLHMHSPAIFKSYPSSGKDEAKTSNFCKQWPQTTPEQRELIEIPQSVPGASQALLRNRSAEQSALLDIGASEIDAGQHQAAFKTLTSALEMNLENAKLVFHLGRLAIACGMMEDAKELFAQAAARNPDMMNAIIDFYHQQLQNARSSER